MTIGKKIIGGYLAIVALLVAVVLAALYGLERTQSAYGGFIDVDQRLVDDAGKLRAESNHQVAAYRAAVLFRDTAASYRQELQDSRRAFRETLAGMAARVRDPERARALDEVADLQAGIEKAQDRVIERTAGGATQAAVAADLEEARQLNDALLMRAERFRERQLELMSQSRAQIETAAQRLALIVTGIALFGIALSVALGGYLARAITQQLRGSITQLSSSAAEILATTTQVASGAAETATAVSQTTATVEEVKQTAEVASQKARYVSDSAQKVAQVSAGGRKSVDETIAGMQKIRDQMQSIAESIVRLNEQSQAIGEIIATVNDLAEQSNLLAVNAAIEASRAGEQGKGFVVVAQEVKSLAEQSKQATAQVRTILGDIQKATNSAVLATEQGGKAVELGLQRSAEAGESIRLLTDSIAEAAQAAIQIAASSQQQVVGMDQVASAMENIKQASQQNVAGTRQAEAAAQGLQALGHQLGALIGTSRPAA